MVRVYAQLYYGAIINYHQAGASNHWGEVVHPPIGGL